MEKLFDVDWNSVFVPTESLLEIFIRGTIMYLGMFALLRIFRRQSGTIGIADLLVIVVIADAAQNGMAGDSKSITEAILLILTIIFWNFLLDFLSDNFKFFERLVEPKKLLLINDGKLLRANLNKEMISYEELMSQLRQQGVEKVEKVKKCYLESNGHFSVLTYDEKSDQTKGNKQSDSSAH